MGKKSGDTGPKVDPVALANAQASANSKTALETQKLNMVGTAGPDGTVKYVRDPSQPGGYTQQTNLSPEQQAIYNQYTQAQNSALGVANEQIGRVDSALGNQLKAPTLQTSIGGNYDQTVKAAQDAAYGQATSRLDPTYNRMQGQLDSKLANQGLSQNSAAYVNAQDSFGRDRADVYNQAAYSAVQAGLQAQNQGFNQGAAQGTFANEAAQQGLSNQAYIQNQPLNQFGALMSNGQVSGPQGIQYTPAQVANTDVIGANALSVQQQNNIAQQKAQNNSAMLGGLFSLGSAAITASDIDVKEDIRQVGTMDNGLPVYTYRYKGQPQVHMGVMAQEAAKVRPEAVFKVNGILHVDYGRL